MRGQLLEENRKGAVFRYNYDAAGNRIRKEETGENRNTKTVYTYNEKNQLIHTEELPEDGNQRRNIFTYSKQRSILKEETESGTCRYFYNGKNQQIRAECADGRIQENRYDAEGLRHEMRENGKLLRFVYQNGELLYEEGGDKETAGCHLGAGIEAVRRGQRTYYYHPDEQLSTALITDETGTIKNQYRYDAFGAGLEASEELPNRIRFHMLL
jgi:YD repeat-containing protein